MRQSFQAPTRFAGQFQSFDPLVGDWNLPANRIRAWNVLSHFLLYELSFKLSIHIEFTELASTYNLVPRAFYFHGSPLASADYMTSKIPWCFLKAPEHTAMIISYKYHEQANARNFNLSYHLEVISKWGNFLNIQI